VVQHVHATLRVALEHAVREELLPRNLAKLVQVAPPPREDREPLTVEEAQTRLKAVRDDQLQALYTATLLRATRVAPAPSAGPTSSGDRPAAAECAHT
jgi:hypothetical protein